MKLFLKMKYRHKIVVVIFLILLPFLIFSLFLVKRTWDERVDGILEENRMMLNAGVDSINELCRSGIQKLTYITNHRLIATFFYNEDFNDLSTTMTVYDNIREIVEAVVAGDMDIRFNVYPLDEDAYNGKYIEKVERLKDRLGKESFEKLMSQIADEPDNGVWMYQEEDDAEASQSLGYIAYYKQMQLFERELAITEMRIRVTKIVSCLQGEFPVGSMLAYRPDNTTGFILQTGGNGGSADWVALEKTGFDAGNYHQLEIMLKYGPGTVTGFLLSSYIQKMLGNFLFLTILMVMLALLVLFFIVEFASQMLTKRLAKLVDQANTDMDMGSSVVPYHADKHWIEDDLGKIEKKFSEMIAKIQANYANSMVQENEKKILELEILQSKINPHFLYNTLSTIRWNCKNEKMAQTIDSMVQYYRLSLNKGESIVTVAHELRLLEEYVKIQKYTYTSDFEYRQDVDDDVKDVWIIKHLLQPVVENSLLHGINGLESGGGVIVLTGRQNGGIITLTISDNGVGMPEETLNQLNSGVYKSKIGGYGIQSIQKRISLFYGSIYHMDFTSEQGKGTTVTITFPVVFPGELFGLNKEQ